MSTTTRLEVMAEVGRLADTLPRVGQDALIVTCMVHMKMALSRQGDDRRVALRQAMAAGLIALEAHDAEKAGA
jgi:hypothetical protein